MVGMAVADDPLSRLGYARQSALRPFIRIDGARASTGSALVAEEVPIALVYNGRSHVVVMGTPLDLEDLAVGFSRTERIIRDADRVERIEVVRASHGIELQIQIPAADAEHLETRARGLVARTGCGLCGVETIAEALRAPGQVGQALMIAPDAIWQASAELSRLQTLNNETKADGRHATAPCTSFVRTSAATTHSTRCWARSRGRTRRRARDSSSSPAARAMR
jgi:formate dehydrogenase assembly factor FdhD